MEEFRMTMITNSIKSIREQYGKKVKIIIMIRHGIKTFDGLHITDECLSDIIKNGVLGIGTEVNVLQHGSFFPRSDETGTAIALNLMLEGGRITKHLPADNRLGNPVIFNLYTSDVKSEMQKRKLNNFQGLMYLRQTEYMRYRNNVNKLIEEVFAKLHPGDVCLMPSHTPTVEIAYNFFAYCPDEFLEIKELDYIFLVQTPNSLFSMKREYSEQKVKI